jgi:DNA-binding LacI/PurR family transcriptional regulator
VTEPPLTTVRQDTVRQGRTMVRMLVALTRPGLPVVADDDLPDVTSSDRVVLPVDLVVRASS